MLKRSKKAKSFTIGIDIGGSNIKFVLLEAVDGGQIKILKKKRILTPKKKSEILEVLKREIKNFGSSFEIQGIGIAIASPLNKKGDLILNPPNLPALKNCRLTKILKKDFRNIPIVLENDANCFTLGEALIGEGKRFKIIFGITLGSGIGGGIVYKKDRRAKIYRGAFGAAGEVGHMAINFNGPKCNCGSFGCLEEYSSIRFFKRKGIRPKLLEKRIKKEKKAREIFKEYGKNLGIGLSNVINLLDPEIIVIGGGISKAYKYFLPEVKREIKKRVVSPLSQKNVKIKISKLRDFGGAVGAALLVLSYRN